MMTAKFVFGDQVRYSDKWLRQCHGNRFSENATFDFIRYDRREKLAVVKRHGRKYLSTIHPTFITKIIPDMTLQHYHDTTNEHENLGAYERSAKSQDERVMTFFITFSPRTWTASQCWESIGLRSENVPLTSCRRAFSNLVKSGKLVKTTIKQKGLFGRSESVYRLVGLSGEPIVARLF